MQPLSDDDPHRVGRGPPPAGAPLGITPEYVREKQFTTRRGGYREDDVDEFLDVVEHTFGALHAGHHHQNLLTATDVHQVVFRKSRLWPGYAEDEVDIFLDEVIAELSRYGLD